MITPGIVIRVGVLIARRLKETNFYFCEAYALTLFLEWRDRESLPALDGLLRHCLPLIARTIGELGGTRFESEDELTSLALVRLFKAFPRYAPERGSIFNFATTVCKNIFKNTFDAKCTRCRYLLPWNAALANSFAAAYPARIGEEEALSYLVRRIRRIKTPYRSRCERIAGGWLVERLLETDFALRKYEAYAILRLEYGFTRKRAREFFNSTLEAVRKELHGSFN